MDKIESKLIELLIGYRQKIDLGLLNVYIQVIMDTWGSVDYKITSIEFVCDPPPEIQLKYFKMMIKSRDFPSSIEDCVSDILSKDKKFIKFQKDADLFNNIDEESFSFDKEFILEKYGKVLSLDNTYSYMDLFKNKYFN